MGMIYPGLPDPIPEPELQPIPEGWAHQPDVITRHGAALRHVLQMPLPQPEKAQGRGILWVGGGKYWPGILVGLKLLREMGCTLPVQIWHRGNEEPIEPELCQRLGPVEFVDSTRFSCRILRGWEQKLVALAHCGWEQVLYLDADAYLVEDPEPLFQALEVAPFVFWEDMGHNETTIRWPSVWPIGHNGVPPIQGGQLMIDRKRAWRVILPALWMNQHSDFYYQHMFGDQDTWRVVLAGLGVSRLWHNLGKAPWQNTAFVCGLSDGKVRVVHRCQGKLMRIGDIPKGRQAYNSPQWALPKETRVFHHLTEYLRGHEHGAEETFGEIYRRELWGNGSSSGGGSIGHESQAYVDLVNTLIDFSDTRSVVDLGCGDGSIGQRIHVANYTGIDCHQPHIDRLKVEAQSREWLHMDFYAQRDHTPPADMLLMKDVLHHWPSSWVTTWLKWAKLELERGRYRRILITQDVNQFEDGQDCHLGGYRALSPLLSPLREFNLKTVVPYQHKACLLME